jgi:hypothetical protein
VFCLSGPALVLLLVLFPASGKKEPGELYQISVRLHAGGLNWVHRK